MQFEIDESAIVNRLNSELTGRVIKLTEGQLEDWGFIQKIRQEIKKQANEKIEGIIAEVMNDHDALKELVKKEMLAVIKRKLHNAVTLLEKQESKDE